MTPEGDQVHLDPYARPAGTSRPSRSATRPEGRAATATMRAPRTAAGTRPVDARALPAPAVDRLPTGRVRVVEKFTGRRVKHRTGALRRLRSVVGLLVIAVIVAAVVATAIAAVVGSIALAIQHALNSN